VGESNKETFNLGDVVMVCFKDVGRLPSHVIRCPKFQYKPKSSNKVLKRTGVILEPNFSGEAVRKCIKAGQSTSDGRRTS
jgi:hypothetical protein